MFAFLCFILLAHAISPASSQDKNIFLLAGQSNMSGRGGVIDGIWDGVIPPECLPNPEILRLASNLTWVSANEPLHKDIDVNTTVGVGPGMAFANSVMGSDSSLGVVGLVPCAIGGTKISQWGRGSFLYDQLVKRASAAVEGGGKIQAVLWYQGESDTEDLEDATMYKGRLEKFFMDIRSDLQSPSLPIIQNIFLLAGQSNMSGRGGVIDGIWDGVIPPECLPNPEILRLASNLTWVSASEPLHKDIDVKTTVGVGPGMAFANSVMGSDSSLGVVGLVPCAIGGTKISQWGRGSFLYDQLVKRASAAVEGGGKIQAVLWYQGESDTEDLEDATLYKGRLEKFFMDIRSDLQSPSLPIIQVALASAKGPFLEKVREAQFGIDLANVKCVDAKGLDLEPDHLHLTTPAQVQLGEMLAGSFLQTRPGPLTNNAPRRFRNYVHDLLPLLHV